MKTVFLRYRDFSYLDDGNSCTASKVRWRLCIKTAFKAPARWQNSLNDHWVHECLCFGWFKLKTWPMCFCFLQTLINSAYCLLLLFGKLIQKVVFGELRVSEQTVSTELVFVCKYVLLTHWSWDKMDAILQTTFSSAFSWMKMYELQLIFRWSLFPRVPLTIFQHRFR